MRTKNLESQGIRKRIRQGLIRWTCHQFCKGRN